MRNVTLLMKKELAAYFNSPIAYIFLIVFNFVCAWLFVPQVFIRNEASVTPFIEIVPLIFLFFIPAVTMRLLSEEQSRGTFEILATLPIRDMEIVLGKFLAAVCLLLAALATTLIFPATLSLAGDLDGGQTFASYLGIFLLGAAFLAMGQFASALVRQDIVAFILGFLFMIAFFLVGKFSGFVPPAFGRMLDYLGVDSHLNGISRGVLDSRDLVYFVSLIVFFLQMTVYTLASRRWR